MQVEIRIKNIASEAVDGLTRNAKECGCRNMIFWFVL